MALNTAVLKTRTITAIVFAAVMMAGLLFSSKAFFVLCVVIASGCVYELAKLTQKLQGTKRWTILIFGSIFIFVSLTMFFLMSVGETGPVQTNNNYYYFFDPLLPCLVLFSIWINDTMAYLTGSLIGKTPFSKVSPKKTVEGTIGGIILCILIIGLVFPLLPFRENSNLVNLGAGHTVSYYFIIPAICAVFGTMGDLLESKIKRMAGVKDSGKFMPGHGGFLDRFDSLLLAVVAVFLVVKLFLQPY